MGNHHSRAPKHHEDRVGNLNSTGADAAAAATPNPPEDANTAPRIDNGSDGSSGESPRRHHLRSHVYQEELGGTVRVLVLGNEGVGKTEVIKHLPTHFSAKEAQIDIQYTEFHWPAGGLSGATLSECRSLISGSFVVVIVVSAVDGTSLDNLEQRYLKRVEGVRSRSHPIVILRNKSDLPSNTHKVGLDELKQEARLWDRAMVLDSSALSPTGLDELKQMLPEWVISIQKAYNHERATAIHKE